VLSEERIRELRYRIDHTWKFGNLNRDDINELLVEVETLNKSTQNMTAWEADHQRTILESYGLADEFPFGCDSVDAVAEALLVARADIEHLRAVVTMTAMEVDRRCRLCHNVRNKMGSPEQGWCWDNNERKCKYWILVSALRVAGYLGEGDYATEQH